MCRQIAGDPAGEMSHNRCQIERPIPCAPSDDFHHPAGGRAGGARERVVSATNPNPALADVMTSASLIARPRTCDRLAPKMTGFLRDAVPAATNSKLQYWRNSDPNGENCYNWAGPSCTVRPHALSTIASARWSFCGKSRLLTDHSPNSARHWLFLCGPGRFELGGVGFSCPVSSSLIRGIHSNGGQHSRRVILDGLALIFIAVGRPKLAVWGALWSFLAGGLTLAEYGKGIDLHIDQLLVADPSGMCPATPADRRQHPRLASCCAR